MTSWTSTLRKTAVAGLVASVVAAGITTLASTEAEAQWRVRQNRGAAIAAGVIGGIAAAAIIAGAANAGPRHNGPVYSHGPGYVPQSYGPAYGYAAEPRCYTRRVREVVDYDTVVIHRVRVCD